MSYQAKIKRYTIIINKIDKGKYPSSRQLLDSLSNNDFDITKRTLQRDIDNLRIDFNIDIEFDNAQKGYFINEASDADLQSFLRFLEIAEVADIVKQTLKEGTESLKYLDLESSKSFCGIHLLKTLLEAIKKYLWLSFNHESYHKEGFRMYEIRPYLLKEYLNRWYVVGTTKDNLPLIFGLDRITDLVITGNKFAPDPAFDARELFANIIGLNYSNGEPVEISLSFSSRVGKYIKSFPLHHSQTIVEDNSERLTIDLYLIPNYELQQRILMYEGEVTVIRPVSLQEDIKALLEKALKNYY